MAWPLDTSWPTWVEYPGSPSSFGSSDFNKVQAAIGNLARQPSAKLSRTDAPAVTTSFTPGLVHWNRLVWQTDTAMVSSSISGTTYVDGINIPYAGLWEVGCTIRNQFNNNTGMAQMFLNLHTSSDNVDLLIDADTAQCNVNYPSFLRCRQLIMVAASTVAKSPQLQAQYVQNSGGDATLTNNILAAYPTLWARLLDLGTT
jgi:hypothetical protein